MIGINPTRGLETRMENVLPHLLSCINHPFFYHLVTDNLSGVFHPSPSFMHFAFWMPGTAVTSQNLSMGPDGPCVFVQKRMHRSEGSRVF